MENLEYKDNTETKQVIVVRKDLNMRKGKIAAQAAHASMKVLLDTQITKTAGGELVLQLTPEMEHWLDHSFTKICVSVDSEEELNAIYEHANKLGIPSAIIVDSGRTEFNGVPTKTCAAIGPGPMKLVDIVTGKLKLL